MKHEFNLIWYLTFLLVFGISFFGIQSLSLGANSTIEFADNDIETVIAAEHHVEYVTALEVKNLDLLAEISEESGEEDPEVKDDLSRSSKSEVINGSHLKFLLPNSELSKHTFSETELLESTPLYLQYEVFRL